MSAFEERQNPHTGFSRKQLGIIFKIAFLEAMALSIILPAASSTGELIPTVFQTGVTQCQIVVPATGAAQCNGFIHFPKKFTTGPSAYGITVSCVSNALQNLAGVTNASQLCNSLGANIDHSETTGIVPIASIPFTTDTINWKNFPSTATPLLGSLNYSTAFNWVSPSVWYPILTITCEQGSSNNNAVIGLAQVNGDGTITPISGSALNISENANSCALQISLPGPPVIVQTPSPPPKAFNISPDQFIVPYGAGGNGAGDQVIISQIRLDLYAAWSPTYSAQIGPNGGNIGVSTTQMPFWVQNQFTSFGTAVPIMQWWACSGC